MRCLKCNLSKNDGIDLYPFPVPGKDTYLKCVNWVKYVYPNEDYQSPQFHYTLHKTGAMLCSRHFSSSSFSDGKLSENAVPDVRTNVEFIEVSTEEPVGIKNSDDNKADTFEIVTQNVDDDENDENSDSEIKYVQYVDSNSELMKVNMLDWAIVKSNDGNSFTLASNSQTSDENEKILPDNITCVLQTNDSVDNLRLIKYLKENNFSNNEEILTPDNLTWVLQAQSDDDLDSNECIMVDSEETDENDEEIVMLEGEKIYQDDSSYVLIETKEGSLVFKESEFKEIKQKPKRPTPYEILLKKKAFIKAKEVVKKIINKEPGPGRKRKINLPHIKQILQANNLKMYLYDCKLCSYKCNSIKEMKEHRTKVHTKLKTDHQYEHTVYNSDGETIKTNQNNTHLVCNKLCEVCGHNSSNLIEYFNHRRSHVT